MGKPLNRSFADVVAAVEWAPGFVGDAELTVDEPPATRCSSACRFAPARAKADAARHAREHSALIYVTGIVTAGAWVFEQAELSDVEGHGRQRLDATFRPAARANG